MIPHSPISVRPAETKDRNQLANMLHFESNVHRHLDWRPPLDWLGMEPYMVAETADNRLVAALACPPDPPGIAWVRMFATTNQTSVAKAWDMLWEAAHHQLSEIPNVAVAAIPLQKWFKELIEKKGFQHIHNVVVLVWDNRKSKLPEKNREVIIRAMRRDDLKTIRDIDEAAFGEIWQNSLDAIQLAYKQSAYATIASMNGTPVGYQISTPSPFGAHLARLAVHPDGQKKGIGFALLNGLQHHFSGLEHQRLSVNTQDNNFASLALYDKAGFVKTEENYPVYQFIFER
ncbi:MAG: GNAT family N-acetyltransferase [Chloroflexota bacterium]